MVTSIILCRDYYKQIDSTATHSTQFPFNWHTRLLNPTPFNSLFQCTYEMTPVTATNVAVRGTCLLTRSLSRLVSMFSIIKDNIYFRYTSSPKSKQRSIIMGKSKEALLPQRRATFITGADCRSISE